MLALNPLQPSSHIVQATEQLFKRHFAPEVSFTLSKEKNI